jgi:beta-N-acetylglucosaminidase
MPQYNTKVVLFGKSTTLKTKELHKSVLNQIEPTEIPKEFICNINLVMDDEQQVAFKIADSSGKFSIEEIKQFLVDKGVSNKVTFIEITIDLDKIATTLTEKTDSFLEKFFDNQ